MDDTDGTEDGTQQLLKERERKMITDKIAALRKRMSTLRETLDLIKSGKDEFKVGDDRPDNVYYILPNLMVEFDVILKSDLSKVPMMNFIGRIEGWITRLQLAVILNRHLLRNKALMEHIEKAYAVCNIIENASETFLKE